ncbi:MAG: patatin family protein [Clostridia bacterium]
MYNAGLVLEGGGMRGMFTAGILDFFLEKNINFKEIIGVSAGACHACSYLSSQKGRAKDISIDYLEDKRYCSGYSLIKTGDLFGADFIYDDIPNKLNIFDNKAFMQNESEFFATVTNVKTGKAEYLPIKDLSKNKDIVAIRASASLPMVSNIIKINEEEYLDGGIADSIPLRQSIKNGFSKNVVILTQPKGYLKSPNKLMPVIKMKYKKYPKFIEKMEDRHLRYNETIDFIDEQERRHNIFVLRPNNKLIVDRVEKDKSKLICVYTLGYNMAKTKYNDLLSYLETPPKP